MSGPDRKRTKTALSKMMRRSYLTTNQKLLETVKITEPFYDFQGFFLCNRSRVQSD